ncbi:MAG: AIR synthase-related protein [Candidatus Gottesmanbacteria bacterium]|nr:AIR synthase-related protein [Candidatus Gottesmanbacteria bacterium]
MNQKFPISYAASGVRYDIMDALKRHAQTSGRHTAKYLRAFGAQEVHASRGESAYVWEEKDSFRAFVMEGLGTKNLVADAMYPITGKTYYDRIAQDTVAMIVNDLIVVGAAPMVVNAYFAVGDSRWFSDKKRVGDLVRGWAYACALAGATWGGGETPTLKGILGPQVIDLAGSAVGIIRPKKRLMLGDKITSGDAIVLLESNGIHANGLTLARSIAQKFPKGYKTKLPDGTLYGEALLKPTRIYVSYIQDLFAANLDIHYMVPITGHGWRKLMRAAQHFTYIIDTPGIPQPIFSFIHKHGHIDEPEMYKTFNMGAGFAVYLPQKQATRAIDIAVKHHVRAWNAGYIKQGGKQVIIRPKNIVFSSETLTIR